MTGFLTGILSPTVISSGIKMAEAPMIPLLLGGILLLLFYRHIILAYGSFGDKITPVILYIVLGLSCSFLFKETKEASILCFSAILLLFTTDLLVSSYQQKRTPFLTFNIGFGSALLTLFHPGFILLIPLFLKGLSQMKLLSWKHCTAYFLAIVSVWWMALLLLTSRGDQWFLIQAYWGQMTTGLPSNKILWMLGFSILFLTILTIEGGNLYSRSLAKERWMFMFHIKLAWLLLLLSVVFSYSPTYLLGGITFAVITTKHLLNHLNKTRAVKYLLLGIAFITLFGSIYHFTTSVLAWSF